MKYTHYSESHVGLVRKANEDSLGDIPCQNGAHAFVVCDGMGGHVGGAVASSMAVKCILDFLAAANLDDCPAAIREACNFANTQVFATAASDPSLQGMGTTCVVLVIKDDLCYFGHVGDSRLYIYSNKELHRLTRDQSFVQMLVDNGEISDDMAESHPKKNQILQAIGIGPEISPKTGEMRISPKNGDKLLLCTDGLNGMMGDKLIASAFRNNDNLKACASNLIQLALEHGGRDNVTVSVIEIESSPHANSGFKSENPTASAPGTQVFEPPKKKNTGSKLLKKYKIHIVLGGFALVTLMIVLLLRNKGGDELPGEDSTKNEKTQHGKEIALEVLVKTPKDQLNGLKNSLIIGVDDKVVKSEKDTLILLTIEKGVFVGYEAEEPKKEESEKQVDKQKLETENQKADQKNERKDEKKKVADSKKAMSKGESENYIVKAGETLTSISKLYQEKGCNVTAEQIANDNGFDSPDQILPMDKELLIKCR